ncbi:MAG: division/cell wall cluster transcriptional repressor MraZ [Clostridia bacterium]|nr:division/cell wall cluster transcriptional repressor MraZ [Clostridia bacterium]
MFSGTYQHSIDQKGRIIIPARFREALSHGFVLTRGLDKCLFIYPASEWEAFSAKLNSIPMTMKEGRSFKRYFFANAVECQLDKQGRVTIPPVMRGFAGIDKDLVTIGVNERIEVWSKDEWESYNDVEIDDELIAEKFADLGIMI